MYMEMNDDGRGKLDQGRGAWFSRWLERYESEMETCLGRVAGYFNVWARRCQNLADSRGGARPRKDIW